MRLSLMLAVALVTIALASCEKKAAKVEAEANQKPVVALNVPSFSGDTAFNYVAKQVAFGPRVPGSKPWQQCGDYLVAELKALGGNVTVQPFQAKLYDGKTVPGKNIIASFYPAQTKRILLAAHWDTRPFSDNEKDTKNRYKALDGANDGASGVGVLLEVARVLKASKAPGVGVDIILFDVEDWGEHQDSDVESNAEQVYWCLGSQHWAKNKHKPDYTAYFGVLLDMVGHKDARFYQEGTSMQFAPSVVQMIWTAAQQAGAGQYFIAQPADGVIDDHVFINRDARIPMVDIIHHEPNRESYFAPTWHTQSDNLDNIDRQTLKAVGQTLLQVLYQEGQVAQ